MRKDVLVAFHETAYIMYLHNMKYYNNETAYSV